MPQIESSKVEEFRNEVYVLITDGQLIERAALDDDFLLILSRNEALCKKYLARKDGDPNRAARLFIETLRIKSKYRLKELSLSHFPREFYTFGSLFKAGLDREGRQCVIMRVKYITPAILDIGLRFKALRFHQWAFSDEEPIYTLIVDCQGVTRENVPFTKFFQILKESVVFYNSLPIQVPLIIGHEVPRAFTYLVPMLKAMVPPKVIPRIALTTNDNITDYVVKEQLPDFIANGKLDIDYRSVPEGCYTLDKVAQIYSIDKRTVDALRAMYEKFEEEDFANRVKLVEVV